MLKSQANVATQGSSTSTSASLAETLQFFMAIVAKEKNCIDTWYLDTYATKYLTSKREKTSQYVWPSTWFSTCKPLKPSLFIFIRDNGNQEAIGVGTIFICLHTSHITKVPNVLHVPHLAIIIVSLQNNMQGSSIDFFHDHCMVKQ